MPIISQLLKYMTLDVAYCEKELKNIAHIRPSQEADEQFNLSGYLKPM